MLNNVQTKISKGTLKFLKVLHAERDFFPHGKDLM